MENHQRMPPSTVSLGDIQAAVEPVLMKAGAVKAIVFGSYARGEADEFSDLDLIIVAESERPFVERFKDFGDIWDLSPVKQVSMFVYTAEEWEEMRVRASVSPFWAAVMTDGKVIYEA